MTNEKRAPYDFNRVTKFEPHDCIDNVGFGKETVATYIFVAPNPKFDGKDKSPYAQKRYTECITIRVYIWAGLQAPLLFTLQYGRMVVTVCTLQVAVKLVVTVITKSAPR